MDVSGMSLQASDVSGQRVVRVHDIPMDATVGELTRTLLSKMELPQNTGGDPQTYQVRLDREGRYLHAGESVGEVLQENDHIRLLPHITAG